MGGADLYAQFKSLTEGPLTLWLWWCYGGRAVTVQQACGVELRQQGVVAMTNSEST